MERRERERERERETETETERQRERERDRDRERERERERERGGREETSEDRDYGERCGSKGCLSSAVMHPDLLCTAPR